MDHPSNESSECEPSKGLEESASSPWSCFNHQQDTPFRESENGLASWYLPPHVDELHSSSTLADFDSWVYSSWVSPVSSNDLLPFAEMEFMSPPPRCHEQPPAMSRWTPSKDRHETHRILAEKFNGHERYETTYLADHGLENARQTLRHSGKNRGIAVDGCRSKHRIAQTIHSTVVRADTNFEKGSISHLDQESAIIELTEPERWRDHLRNLAVSLGQLCTAYPIVLYQPVRHIQADKLLHQQTDNLRVHLVEEVFLQYWKYVVGPLSSLLPAPIATRINDPSPSLFLAASLLLGILVNAQCHYNRKSVFRKPFLVAGVVLTLFVNTQLWYAGGIPTLSGTTSIALTAILSALISSQIADTVKRCFDGKCNEMERVQSVLRRLHPTETASCVRRG
ncbi:hypothetical protein TW65_05515 [Stemphylium lycopersici]|uniref:Uncharacterized protein n=1 Tax=Stemphylium lycopersici TaxID=183478 RepID=A0A364MZE7_STELY|nr:hypothetical protein TW65_05515 [Stemphylium lycopersici]RAR07358.1 hypothetical protein DDE83_006540 [Stemphylium lycopersici]